MQRRILSLATVTGLALSLGVLAASPSVAATGAPSAGAARQADGCQVIAFDKAEVTPLATTTSMPPTIRYRLTVAGTASASNVAVKLTPLVYIRQPAYWGIEVVGCSSGIGLPVLTPYTATLDFTGPMGTCGIQVIGAKSSQLFDLARCAKPAPVTGTA